MTLTAEQIAAMQLGEAVDVGANCLSVRAAVFSTLRNASGESFTAEELRTKAVRTFDDADMAEPIQP